MAAILGRTGAFGTTLWESSHRSSDTSRSNPLTSALGMTKTQRISDAIAVKDDPNSSFELTHRRTVFITSRNPGRILSV